MQGRSVNGLAGLEWELQMAGALGAHPNMYVTGPHGRSRRGIRGSGLAETGAPASLGSR